MNFNDWKKCIINCNIIKYHAQNHANKIANLLGIQQQRLQ